MCRKLAHRTRQAALDQMKAVIWRNTSRHEDGRSHGLNVYRCRICLRWHVGHDRNAKDGERCR